MGVTLIDLVSEEVLDGGMDGEPKVKLLDWRLLVLFSDNEQLEEIL